MISGEERKLFSKLRSNQHKLTPFQHKAKQVLESITATIHESVLGTSILGYYTSLKSMLEYLSKREINIESEERIKKEAYALYILRLCIYEMKTGTIQSIREEIWELVQRRVKYLSGELITNQNKNNIHSNTRTTCEISIIQIIKIIRILMKSTPIEIWSEPKNIERMKFLLALASDPQINIRREGSKALMALLKIREVQNMHKLQGALESRILRVLGKMKDSPNTQEIDKCLNMVYFLNMGLAYFSLSIGCNIAFRLREIAQIGYPVLLCGSVWLTLQTYFAGGGVSVTYTPDPGVGVSGGLGVGLPGEFVVGMLEEVLNTHQPLLEEKEMGLLHAAYVQALTQILLHLYKVKGDVWKYIPSIISVLSEYILSPSLKVSTVSISSLKHIFNTCLHSQPKLRADSTTDILSSLASLEMGENQQPISPIPSMTILQRSISTLIYLFTPRYKGVVKQVLDVVGSFVASLSGILLHDIQPLFMAVVNTTHLDMRSTQWKDCIGVFISHIGSLGILKMLPLDLLSHDLNDEEYATKSHSYLLPLLQKHLPPSPLSHFIQTLLPISDSLTKVLKGEDIYIKLTEIKHKKYLQLQTQIWELVPKYTKITADLEKNMPRILPMFDKIMNGSIGGENNYLLQSYILNGLISLLEGVERGGMGMGMGMGKLGKLGEMGNMGDMGNIGEMSNMREAGLVKGFRMLGRKYVPSLSKVYEKGEWRYAGEGKLLLRCVLQFARIGEGGWLEEEFLARMQKVLGHPAHSQGHSHNTIILQVNFLSALIHGLTLSQHIYHSSINFVTYLLNTHNPHIQKSGYKFLASLILKLDITTLPQLREIYATMEPFVGGVRASRVRLLGRLALKVVDLLGIKEFMSDSNTYEDEESGNQGEFKFVDVEKELGDDVLSYIQNMLPEFLLGVKDPSAKVRKHAVDIILQLSNIAHTIRMLQPFIQILITGLGTRSSELRSATIQCLGRVMYQHRSSSYLTEELRESATSIILLLLKEDNKQIMQAVLNYIKVIIAILPNEVVSALPQTLLPPLFLWPKPQLKGKYRMNIRFIISKLIKRVGDDVVREHIPGEDKSIVGYICRELRKARMKRQNKRREFRESNKKKGEEYEEVVGIENLPESEGEGDLEGEEEVWEKRSDSEYTSESDIPEENIPIIGAYDPPEAQNPPNPNPSDLLDTDSRELHTHFTENETESIRKRGQEKEQIKRAYKKRGEGKEHRDVYFEKETGKLQIKDEGEGEGEKTVGGKRGKIEGGGASAKRRDNVNINMYAHKRVKGKGGEDLAGHQAVESGDKYKNKLGGGGDVWKKGQKFEPYAYIRLNPKMATKKKRQIAIKNFEKIIGKGKSGATSNILKGMKVRK